MTDDPTAAPTLREARRVAGWGLAFWGAAQLAGAVFSQNATALVAVQAALAEWGAGRVGITWSDPLAPMPTAKALARRAGTGLAIGGGMAAAACGVALLTHLASVAAARPSAGSLAVGLVLAVLSAVRDELFLRGIVLRVTRGLWPTWATLAAAGGVAAAARFGAEGALGLVLVVEALRGVAMAALWLGDRGAWMAVGASAGWAWGLGSIAGGGLVDVRFAAAADAGVPALAVVAASAAAACFWASRRHPRQG
jgi:hypothetical protein